MIWKIKMIKPLVMIAVLGLMIGCSTGVKTQQSQANKKGTYHVVGIGPGDADLLTTRAKKVIQNADLVFCNKKTCDKLDPYVDLKNKQVINGFGVLFRFYGKDCSKLKESDRSRGGKTCQEYHEKQAEFARLVRRAVRDGKNVVMLTSGDPTIYGPDIWSVKELNDLDPVVVPGLSSFNAATAALKVGLGEVVLTAPFKGREGKETKDTIENLVKHDRATLVIFMPRNMDELLARLSASCPGNTPMALVSYAGHKDRERVITGTVADMATKLAGRDTKNTLVYVGKALEEVQYREITTKKAATQGKFFLVGTGPGDADLATIRALEVIKKADLIFASKKICARFEKELAGKNVLQGYHRLFPFYGKECSNVTQKQKSRERMSCEQYHEKQNECADLVRKAVAQGKTVAMLDSGDPLIYGPCSWTLKEFKDIDTEVVPGLSCFNAANAALAQGVTEGKTSHSVILASGWSVDEMAPFQSTMAIFTMRTEFQTFINTLSRHYPSDTPLAIVSSAGYSEKEKVVRGTLGTIMAQTGGKKLPFEYLLYVGDFLKNGEEN